MDPVGCSYIHPEPDGMESSWGCCSELSLGCPCGGCCPAGLGVKPAAQENPGAAQAVPGGRMEEANLPVGFQGSAVSPDLSAVSRMLWDVPFTKTLPLPCPQTSGASPSSLNTCEVFWTLSSFCGLLIPMLLVFLGGLINLLQNGAFSFPYGHRGKEIITRGLLRLGWSQHTQEDEELTSHWALPLVVPFLEQTFHGAGQGKADWGLGFFPSQELLRHTQRAPVHKDPKVLLANEKLNLSCESLESLWL